VEDHDHRSCYRRPLTWGFSRVFPGPQHHAVPYRKARNRSRTEEARGFQIPSPPPPTSQVRASSASSGRRSPHVAAAARPRADVAVQPGRLAAPRRLGPGPPAMTTERSRHLAAHLGSLPTGDPRAHPAYHGRPRGRPRHCPTTFHDDGQVQADASAGLARPAPASIPRFRPGQTRSRSWTWRATTPTPAIPAMRLPAPPPPSTTSLRSDTADAGTHGHRTPDTWTLRRPHRTVDTGRVDRHAWTLDARTGHWTLAEDADTVTKHDWHPHLLGHHAQRPRAGTPNRVPVNSACGAWRP
jgi:hypothetical protein